MNTKTQVEESELSEKQKEIADLCTRALDETSKLNIEIATVTKDNAEGKPVAACILVLAGEEKTIQILGALAKIEESWDETGS